jgi:hypothetical protein
MIEFSKKENRTNVLPLRWFGNCCEHLAHFFLDKYLYWDHLENINKRAIVWSWLSSQFYKPYMKWGTFYSVDMDAWKEHLKNDPVLDILGSDYDEDGIPYWEK